MPKWLAALLSISGFFTYGLSDIIITELTGTNNAEFGSSHSLRCSYTFENETGVEIKWFYNGDDQIFVWIPNRTKPNAIDSWKSVLDTNDTVPDHDVKHSVLHFKELNFNLTGYYTCKVTGDEHEDAKTEKMIVYRPASFVEFDILSEENDTITLGCSVYEMYPKPTINVTGSYLPEKNLTVEVFLKNETSSGDLDSLFNITKVFTFNKTELTGSLVEFSCNVAVQETEYVSAKQLQYTKSSLEAATQENPEPFEPNDTTVAPEIGIVITKIALDNAKTQEGGWAGNCEPHFLHLWLLLMVVLVRQFLV